MDATRRSLEMRIKTIEARMSSIEKTLNTRIDSLEKTVNTGSRGLKRGSIVLREA